MSFEEERGELKASAAGDLASGHPASASDSDDSNETD
jgi:hypothetical protein